MKQTFDYHCKFCGIRRQVSAEIPVRDDGTPALDVSKWLKILCCPRCYEYEDRRRRTERQICQTITLYHTSGAIGSESADARREVLRKNLTLATQQFARLVCDRFSQAFSWEPEFVDHLLAKETCPGEILSDYQRVIRKMPVGIKPPSSYAELSQPQEA